MILFLEIEREPAKKLDRIQIPITKLKYVIFSVISEINF